MKKIKKKKKIKNIKKRQEKNGRRKKKKEKENSTELQKPTVEAEVYNNNKKMWLRGKKKLKSLTGFHIANKINK